MHEPEATRKDHALTMDDVTRKFSLESCEDLERLEQDSVKLETEPGNLTMNAEITSALLAMVDAVRQMLAVSTRQETKENATTRN